MEYVAYSHSGNEELTKNFDEGKSIFPQAFSHWYGHFEFKTSVKSTHG